MFNYFWLFLSSSVKASIILESDSAIVLEAIKRRNQSKSWLWKLYEDIKKVTGSSLQCEVSKISAESNSAAHVLSDTDRLNGKITTGLGMSQQQ
jgi:ribonuclease HI